MTCIDFHPYGDFLATGSADTNLKLWDTRRKGCIFTYKGHSERVNSLKFSPDGQWIASAGEEGAVKVSCSGCFSITDYGPRFLSN